MQSSLNDRASLRLFLFRFQCCTRVTVPRLSPYRRRVLTPPIIKICFFCFVWFCLFVWFGLFSFLLQCCTRVTVPRLSPNRRRVLTPHYKICLFRFVWFVWFVFVSSSVLQPCHRTAFVTVPPPCPYPSHYKNLFVLFCLVRLVCFRFSVLW